MRWLLPFVLAVSVLGTWLLVRDGRAPLPAGATALADERPPPSAFPASVGRDAHPPRTASGPQPAPASTRPGVGTHATLWDRPAAILRATLTDPEGRPLRNRHVAFELLLAEGAEAFSLSTTDAEGSFTWHVGSKRALVDPVRSVRYAVAPWSAEALAIEVPLQRTLRSGLDELGVLRLVPPPVVVAGVVVDEGGRPHPETVLELQVPAADPVHGGSERSEDGRAWEALWPPVRTKADAEGRFAFLGALTAAAVALRAHPPEAPSGTLVPFTVGERAARLVVPRGAALAGSCLLDDPISARDVVIVVESGEAGTPTELERVAPQPDGTFRAARLPPGVVTVVVTLRERLVARIPGIRVAAGETARDPRLSGIDARTGGLPLQVRVTDARRQPVFCARVQAWRGGERVAEESTDREGRVRLVVPSFPVELWVDDPASRLDVAYRPRFVRAVAADTEVALDDGPRVRITFDRAVEVPPELRLRAMLEARETARPAGAPPAEAGSPFGFGAPRFGAPRLTESFVVPGPGAYAPLCSLQRADGRTVEFYAEPGTVQVLDVPTPQVVVVRVPATALANAIAALGDGK